MKITIDSLRKSVDDKFQKLEIEDLGIAFENPMRRDAEGRAKFRTDLNELVEVGRSLGEIEDEQEAEEKNTEALKGLLRSVLVEGDFSVLEEAIGDDALIWNELFSDFMESLKVGEASASQN